MSFLREMPPHPFGFRSLGALIITPACWIWALHLATGLFDHFLRLEPTKRVEMIAALDRLTRSVLVEPLGTTGAVIVMVVLGFLPLIHLLYLSLRKSSHV